MSDLSPSPTQRLNQYQKKLRVALTDLSDQSQALELFLEQHARLHTGVMSKRVEWSYADQVLEGISEEIFRRIPQNREHSPAWCLWHLARIEDVTMNLLVAGKNQVLVRENWLPRLEIPYRDTGNGMTQADINTLSAGVNLDALLDYRMEVGRQTRQVVSQLDTEDLRMEVDPIRLEKIHQQQAVLPSGWGVVEYWAKRTIAELLLMPPTRHCIVHLNEIQQLKKRKH